MLGTETSSLLTFKGGGGGTYHLAWVRHIVVSTCIWCQHGSDAYIRYIAYWLTGTIQICLFAFHMYLQLSLL